MRPRTKTDEGFLVARESTKLGFKSIIILDAAISYFMPKTTKVLMGCKGIFRDGSIMNATGALNIAILSKHYGVPLYVFAESSKMTYNYENIEHRPLDEIFDDNRIKQIIGCNIEIFNPASDIVPPECINEIIMEIGKYKPEQIKQVLD
jgi:ribose 1,5-bisphosphate isomerase